MLPGLWGDAEFLKRWAGQTISLAGSQVTRVAVPLTAVLLLGATPAQMGVLQAIQALPHLALGFAAGVWVDRLRRRPIMIGADLGRAALLAGIPVAALLGVLRIEQVYAVVALTAALDLFFDVAATSFLPSFVRREQLVDANGKLAASASLAQVAGPGLAGGLVQAVTAPVAVAVDAASFVISAAFLWRMRVAEPPAQPTTPAAPVAPSGASRAAHPSPPPQPARRNAWREAGEGLRVVLANPLLRAFAGASGAFNLFTQVFWAVYLLYLTRDLDMAPAVIGLAFAAGGIGGLIGAVLAARLAGRIGPGPAIVLAALVTAVGWWPVLVAGGPPAGVGALLMSAHFLRSAALTVFGVTVTSLRQALVPDRLQGRVAATMRVIGWGTLPVGSLAGGALGEWLGLRPTLVIGALGGVVGFLWIALSPVRTLRAPPAPAAAALT